MRALTLTQPWATLVAIGAKTIETRSWGTSYVGSTIAIHAAKGMPAAARDACHDWPFGEVLRGAGFGNADPEDELPRGAIVAVADLHVCFQMTEHTERWVRERSAAGRLPRYETEFGFYAAGRYGFKLVNVRALERPIPCRGMLSLWHVPLDVETAIYEQLDAPNRNENATARAEGERAVMEIEQ